MSTKIGRGAADIPLNQFLGKLAYQDTIPPLEFTGTTTDATPTVIGSIPLDELVTMGVVVHVLTTEYNVSGERGYYIRQALFYRDVSDDVTLQGSVQTIGNDIEVTAGQDVTLTANTTDQTIDITVTGVAASNIKWLARVELIKFANNVSS